MPRPLLNQSHYALTGRTPVDGAGEAMKPHVYHYKEAHNAPMGSSQPGGLFAGNFAQELERHPLTRQAVQHTPDGLKVMLAPHMSTMSAVIGRHNDRLNLHEHHITGLMRAHSHVKQAIDEHAKMLESLHNILSRKLT